MSELTGGARAVSPIFTDSANAWTKFLAMVVHARCAAGKIPASTSRLKDISADTVRGELKNNSFNASSLPD